MTRPNSEALLSSTRGQTPKCTQTLQSGTVPRLIKATLHIDEAGQMIPANLTQGQLQFPNLIHPGFFCPGNRISGLLL